MKVFQTAAFAFLCFTGSLMASCAQAQEKPPPAPAFGENPPPPPSPPEPPQAFGEGPQDPPPPPKPLPPPGKDSPERREKIERIEAEIRELEGAFKRDDLPAEKRDEIKKRLSEKYAQLKELRGGDPWWGKEGKGDLHEKARRLEMAIAEMETALRNKDRAPEEREALISKLHGARVQLDELRAQMKGDPLNRRDITGKVTATVEEHGMMVLSLGRDHGVNEGDEFTIHRESLFIAKIVIDRVDRNWSSGRVTLKGKDAPRVGDVASRNMLGRPFQDHRPGPPMDPESQKLHMAAQELDRASMDLAAKLRMVPKDAKDDRAAVISKLKETVVQLFDLREKIRAREVEMIKKRLEELTQMLEKRKANRDAIIEKRLKQLTGESDDLDW